jgi:hypothetical protein
MSGLVVSLRTNTSKCLEKPASLSAFLTVLTPSKTLKGS